MITAKHTPWHAYFREQVYDSARQWELHNLCKCTFALVSRTETEMEHFLFKE